MLAMTVTLGALLLGATFLDVPRPVYDAEPKLVALYDKAWEIARGRIHTTPGMPAERYMDEALWDSDIWIWDSAFMAFFCKYAPKSFPGIETLDNFYAILLKDGDFKIPRVICDNPYAKEKLGELTPLSIHLCDNPPILAWAELAYAKHTGDRKRLERVLKTKAYLPRYYELVENMKPGWITEGVRYPATIDREANGYHWKGGPSGMDNTPRGKTKASDPRPRPDNPDLLWVDLLSQQALAARCISEGFGILGDKAEETAWRKRWEEKRALLNRLYWQEDDGFYYDVFASTLKSCRVTTPASYWAMLAGAPSEAQARRMFARVADGGELSVPAGVATLSTKDADFDPSGRYWRGSMWLPTQYMTVKALERYGAHDLAGELALRTVRHQLATYEQVDPHTIWECYNPLKPLPATKVDGKRRVTPHFCGWSALGPISLFIENVIGISSVDAFAREVRWNLPKERKGRVGVERFRFGDVVCDLVCEGDVIDIRSTGDFTLFVNGRACAVGKGDTRLSLRTAEWMLPGQDVRVEGVLPPGVVCTKSVRSDSSSSHVRFEIRNEGAGEAAVAAGDFGFLFPFDSVFDRSRTHAAAEACVSHVWCGGEVAWVWAAHPDGTRRYYSAVLEEGALDSYSLHCDMSLGGMYRGSPVLNPPRFTLSPGESKTFSFRICQSEKRPDRDVMPGNVVVSAETFSPAVGEKILLRLSSETGQEMLEMAFDSPGEKLVPVEAFGRKFVVRFDVLEDLDVLLQRRAKFIVRHQQAGSDRGELDGAYLIYDRSTGKTVVGPNDHNAGRERLSMGVLVALAARRSGDEELIRSLERHRTFVLRELFDPATGTVFNDVGRNNSWHRNYNYPWMSVYWLETWRLTRDIRHLRHAASVLRAYYEKRGGLHEESPCLYVLETIRELEAAGLEADARFLREDLVRHADDILMRNGRTVSQEVTVTHGGANIRGSILAQALLLTGDPRYRPGLEADLRRAEAFYSLTPDARLYLQPVRHWDGFWFGGARHYGDTFPQWLGGLTAEMYLYAGRALERDYRRFVRGNLRGLLSAFQPDGFASCA